MAQSFSAQQMADIQRAIDQAHNSILSNVQGVIPPGQEGAYDQLPGTPTPPGSPGLPDPGEFDDVYGGVFGLLTELMNDIQELRMQVTNLVDQVNTILYGGYLIDVKYNAASRTFSKTTGRAQPNLLGGVSIDTEESPVFVAATDCD